MTYILGEGDEYVERGARAHYERFNESTIGCCEPTWYELQPDFRERLIDAFRTGLEAMR
jgi:hypothetical protein